MRGPRSSLGAYYTTPETADWLARWALAGGARTVLEPSFGEGVFLRALASAGAPPGALRGVELDPAAHGQAVAQGLIGEAQAICGDFLRVAPFEVDAVLGNPPYVRLRHLPAERAHAARRVADQALGAPMQSSGSLWMPFVLHGAQFLRRGGRMGFVLPFDLTYVRYARPLWRWLAERFGGLKLIRVRQRIFPEILQQVVLLLCEGWGERTDRVELRAFEGVAELEADRPVAQGQVQVQRVVQGHRDLLRAHLSAPVQDLLEAIEPRLAEVRSLCRFHIGYVTGHKAFFHPSPAQREAYPLPEQALRPALTSSRQVSGGGLYTSALSEASMDRLFLPVPSELTAGEAAYLEDGVELGVPERYKCRVRDPWFVVPDVRVPDLLLTVFSERPLLLINDRRLVVSNSLLAGFLRPGQDPRAFVSSWYTPLTRLYLELQVHALGGGVMVLVPGEVGRVRVMPQDRADDGQLAQIDAALREGRSDEAYQRGEGRLRAGLGLSAVEVARIFEGIEALARWRSGGPPAPRG